MVMVWIAINVVSISLRWDPYPFILLNLMFSVHMWWSGRSASQINAEVQESVNMNLPLVVGEFAQTGVGCNGSIDYRAIIAACKTYEIGFYAWEWGPGNTDCNLMDMTPNNSYASLWGWAKEVAVTDANSIQNTAKPLPSLNGQCQ
jgi:mannan endo-1,4-beta-mannosidase